MKTGWCWVSVLAGAMAVAGCGGDDDEGEEGGSATGGAGQGGDEPGGAAGAAATATGGASLGGAGGAGADPCEEGCVETLAADCDNGPASAAECERDCRSLLAGACGAEYRTLQACAAGEAITCDPQGIPVIEACAAEQSAFVACLG